VNKLSGFLKVAAVSAPGLCDQRKSWLQDIALLTGGKALMEGLDIQLKTYRSPTRAGEEGHYRQEPYGD